MKLQNLLSSDAYSKVVGNTSKEITSVVSIFEGPFTDSTLTWVNDKNLHEVSKVNAGTVILSTLPENLNSNLTYLVSTNPRTSFKKILDQIYPDNFEAKIEPTAHIDSNTTIGEGCYIGFNVVIEKGCVIGKKVSIGHNTVLKENTKIGNHVTIGSNCTIGGVGFGYQKDETGKYELIKHVGSVRILDNVDIGNNTCIDRAVLGETLIEENVKIDNLVHIAHNAKIRSNALIIANAMVAGSCDIGANTWVAPSSSVINGITLGKDVTVGMGAVVLKPVNDGEIVVGNPGKLLVKKV